MMDKMDIKLSKLSRVIVVLTALFSTMPIVTLSIGESRLTLYNLFLVFFFSVLIINKKRSIYINCSSVSGMFYAFYITCIISSLYGCIALHSIDNSSDIIISGFLRLTIYTVLLTLLLNAKSQREICEYYLKGLMIGFIVNVVVAVIDGAGFYLTGKSLVNTIFHSYALTLTTRYEMISIINNGSIRVAGLNFDPASLGFISAIVVLYSLYIKKYYLTILGVGAIFFAQSLTGVFAIICCLVIDSLIKNKNKPVSQKNQSIKGKTVLTTGAIIIIVFFVILTSSQVTEKLNMVFGLGKENITNRIVAAETEQRTRIGYNIMFFKVATDNPLNTFIGTGFGTSSVPYQMNSEAVSFTTLSTLYDIENTYIAMVFDCGIVGAFIYFLMYYKTIQAHKNKIGSSVIIYYGMLSSVFCMFTYHYILASNLMMLLFISIILIKGNKYPVPVVMEEGKTNL